MLGLDKLRSLFNFLFLDAIRSYNRIIIDVMDKNADVPDTDQNLFQRDAIDLIFLFKRFNRSHDILDVFLEIV